MGKHDHLKPNTLGIFSDNDNDRVKVAVRLILQGHPLDMVSKATGLKMPEVRRIAAETRRTA